MGVGPPQPATNEIHKQTPTVRPLLGRRNPKYRRIGRIIRKKTRIEQGLDKSVLANRMVTVLSRKIKGEA
jgi:hypothetical protein